MKHARLNTINLKRKQLANTGFSLVELLMVLALSGLMAAMVVGMMLPKASPTWARVAEDYIEHLSAVYSKIQLQSGDSPIQAQIVPDPNPAVHNPLYADGIATVLQTSESLVTYSAASPPFLSYPSKIRVYLNPEDTNIPDTSNQLPRHQAGALAPGAVNPATNSATQTIMAGTEDREWLLLDMNGADGPNTMGTNGDRVLLIVDDVTGRVLTAWQKCWMLTNALTPTYPAAATTTCTLASPAPSRTYYKSFYDVYKKYET